jgi:hypothetical protein
VADAQQQGAASAAAGCGAAEAAAAVARGGGRTACWRRRCCCCCRLLLLASMGFGPDKVFGRWRKDILRRLLLLLVIGAEFGGTGLLESKKKYLMILKLKLIL